MKHNNGKGEMYDGMCPTCKVILRERETARMRELGVKGGKARALKLTPERRKEIASQGGESAKTAREWGKFKKLAK